MAPQLFSKIGNKWPPKLQKSRLFFFVMITNGLVGKKNKWLLMLQSFIVIGKVRECLSHKHVKLFKFYHLKNIGVNKNPSQETYGPLRGIRYHQDLGKHFQKCVNRVAYRYIKLQMLCCSIKISMSNLPTFPGYGASWAPAHGNLVISWKIYIKNRWR